MKSTTAPTDQRAGVRPIAFALDNGKGLGSPIALKIRPEDLTRTEPSRIAVHQTLGHGKITGWVDNFGLGMPSVNIVGHTGWRVGAYSGEDGVQAFEKLNKIVLPDYHAAKQAAIDSGSDPSRVKLLFIDMLDGFTWSVAPMSFVLRRSKSRPLLMQYNIALQAVDTAIDNPFKVIPFFGSISGGLASLSGVIGLLNSWAGSIDGWVKTAVSTVDSLLAPISKTVSAFSVTSSQIFQAVHSAVSSVNGGITATANSLIKIASDAANVGLNVFRTLSSLATIPQNIKYALSRVAAAYNEVVCIFKNSLRPRKVYQDFDGLFGASNCSSTTGGRLPSAYSNSNVFSLLQPVSGPVSVSSAAQSSMNTLGRGDVVLAPLAVSEIGRNLETIVSGVTVAA